MVKVLVIDDEKLLLKSTCMALKFYGYEVVGVLDGQKGLEEVATFKPDIILLDIMMPAMDGWQVLSLLKADATMAKIPVIIFTAKEHPNGPQLAHEKGAFAYLAKPFEPKQLVVLLKECTLE